MQPKPPMQLDPAQQALKDFGNAAFGDENWHGKLARLSGVSRSYISQIVRGKKPLTVSVDQQIQDGFGEQLRRQQKAFFAYRMRGKVRLRQT
jgi:transcriptional regulator with XRE-family HTH domain